ncbi:hypothetical protein BH11ARM1_BH11ARM1_06620 [soil metagenome]
MVYLSFTQTQDVFARLRAHDPGAWDFDIYRNSIQILTPGKASVEIEYRSWQDWTNGGETRIEQFLLSIDGQNFGGTDEKGNQLPLADIVDMKSLYLGIIQSPRIKRKLEDIQKQKQTEKERIQQRAAEATQALIEKI